MTGPSRPSSSASPMSLEALGHEDDAPPGLVVVATYPSALEAELAKSCLEAAGVEAELSDQHTVSIASHLAGAVGGVKVRVPEDDAERAREVLAEAAVVEGASEDDDVDEAPRSPTKEALANRALASAVFGAIFFPPLNLYSLWLLLEVARGEGEASPRAKRRAAMALVFDAVILVALAVLLLR